MMVHWAHNHFVVHLTATARLTLFISTALAIAGLFTGCEQKMGSQPSYRPLESSRFFADGRASRPLVDGTVPRGTLENNSPMLTGRKVSVAPRRISSLVPTTLPSSSTTPLNPDEFTSELPFDITLKTLERGQERYSIYCAVCHGATGAGNGIVVRRGYTKPPSYLTDDSRQLARSGFRVSLRSVPIGYFFEVMSHGYGAMADYSMQIEPRDRWAIAAYIRTLQFSQDAPLDSLPADIQKEALQTMGAKP
jgi:mono/diheme cytochrome c family protein